MGKPSRRPNREERKALKKKIKANQAIIREQVLATGSAVINRTQAVNEICPEATPQEQAEFYQTVASEQIKAWRSLLPNLLRDFAQMKDPRNPESLRHKTTVLMLFGLLMFVFRFDSRRQMNKDLTEPLLVENLRIIFPELETIPHADTLARFLEYSGPDEIEAIHISLIRELIKKKKVKSQLIYGNLPISIDGTEKLCRDGILNEIEWLDRQRREGAGWKTQQYVAVVEANITLPCGLSIPLLSEYLFLDEDKLNDADFVQDCEMKAAMRLIERLRKHFPRLKMILVFDKLYTADSILALLEAKKFQYMMKLPEKLKSVKKALHNNKPFAQSIPEQSYCRGRHQQFYWENDITYGEHIIHAVACIEDWNEVDQKTGNIIKKYSEHDWVSSIPLSIDNVYILCNLCARKRAYIEDNMNTEKNRGYRYKHAFSYNWNAMRGFHALMRLGHAINALSEFTKKLKKYICKHGWSYILRLIFRVISNPWFTKKWLREQAKVFPQLRLKLE